MSETICITNKEYHDVASTLAQQCGGVFVVSCTVFINQDGGLSLTKGTSTIDETQGLTLLEWYCNNDYVGSEVEKTFSTSGIMVMPDTYVISGNVYNGVNILNRNTNI